MWEFYVIELLGNIRDTSLLVSIITGIVLFGLGFFIFLSMDDYEYSSSKLSKPKKLFKNILIIFIAAISIITLIPSRGFMYINYSINTTIEYIQGNEEVKKISSKTLQIINNKLDKYIEEGIKNNKE